MNNCFIYPGVVINPLTLRSLDQTQNQQQNEIIQMLSKAAKTDDDLEDDDCDLGDALGGLTDMQKMSDLINDLRQQNQNFVIEISPTKHMFFEYFYDDPIFKLTGPKTAT